jgi:hypothetical protein
MRWTRFLALTLLIASALIGSWAADTRLQRRWDDFRDRADVHARLESQCRIERESLLARAEAGEPASDPLIDEGDTTRTGRVRGLMRDWARQEGYDPAQVGLDPEPLLPFEERVRRQSERDRRHQAELIGRAADLAGQAAYHARMRRDYERRW